MIFHSRMILGAITLFFLLQWMVVCAASLPEGFIHRARDHENSESTNHVRLCISCVSYNQSDSMKRFFYKHNETFHVIFASRDLDRVCYVHEKQSELHEKQGKLDMERYALPKWLQIHRSVVDYLTSSNDDRGVELYLHLYESSTLASFFHQINAVKASDVFGAHGKISSAWSRIGTANEYVESYVNDQFYAPQVLDNGHIISLVIPAESSRESKRELFWFVNKALLLDNVVSVSISQLFELSNYQATGMVQGGRRGREIYTSLLGSMHLRGKREIVGVSDTGLDDRSCFFRDYARGNKSDYESQYTTRDKGGLVETRRRKVVQYVNFADDHDEEGGHGTHVVGSIVGKSLDNFQQMDGVAPEAKVSFFDIQCGSAPTLHIPRDLGSMFDFHKRAGSYVYSNSFGRPTGMSAYYDAQAYLVDKYIYEEVDDPLVVFSAGNYGFMGSGTIMSPGNGKNVLTVGAVTTRDDSDNSLDIDDLHIAPFSSLGPVAGTLRKPDIVMNGDFVESAYASTMKDGIRKQHNVESCSTFEMSGTSMSAPLTSGCALLIRNYFKEEAYWGNLCPTSEAGFNNSINRVQTIRRVLSIQQRSSQGKIIKNHEREVLLRDLKARKTHSTCQQGSFHPTGYLLKALLIHASRKVRAYSMPLYNNRTIINSFLFDAYGPPDNLQGYGYPLLSTTLPLSDTFDYEEEGEYVDSTGNKDRLQQKLIKDIQKNQPDLYVWEFLMPQNSTLSFTLNYSYLAPFQAFQRDGGDNDNKEGGERDLKSIPLKATLVWPDPPSSSGFYGMTQYLLQHDLDLVIINRDREVAMYSSCNLKRDDYGDDDDGNGSIDDKRKYPCSESDSANNNEQFIIHEPQASSYEVVVQSHYYPQALGDQKVALVLSVDPAVMVSEPKLQVSSSVQDFLHDRHGKGGSYGSKSGQYSQKSKHNNSTSSTRDSARSEYKAPRERDISQPDAYFSRTLSFTNISLVPVLKGSTARSNSITSTSMPILPVSSADGSTSSDSEQFVPTKHLLDSFLMNRQSRLLRVELKCRPIPTNLNTISNSDDSPSHPRRSVPSKALDAGTQCWALAVVIRSEQDMVRIQEDRGALIPDMQITRSTRHQCIQTGGLDFVACAADYYGRRWPTSWLYQEGEWPVTRHNDGESGSSSDEPLLVQLEAERDLSPADFSTDYPTLANFESPPLKPLMEGAIRAVPSHPTPPSEPETYPGRYYIELSLGFTADSSQNVQPLKYSGEVVLHFLDETILFKEKEREEEKNKNRLHYMSKEQMMTLNLYLSLAFLALVLLLAGFYIYARFSSMFGLPESTNSPHVHYSDGVGINLTPISSRRERPAYMGIYRDGYPAYGSLQGNYKRTEEKEVPSTTVDYRFQEHSYTSVPDEENEEDREAEAISEY